MFSPGKDSVSIIVKKLDIVPQAAAIEDKPKLCTVKEFSKEYSKDILNCFDTSKEMFPAYYMINGCSMLMLKDLSELKPKGIIFFDVDQTLIDYDKSIKTNQLEFLYQDIFTQEFKLARDNNFLIGLLTARTYCPFEFFLPVAGVRNIVTTLGKELFDFIIYTNNVCGKVIPMRIFQSEFGLSAEKLCLIDDLPIHVIPCDVYGFVGVHPDAAERQQKVRNFLLSAVSVSEPQEKSLSVTAEPRLS